jgi:hypothetical protein
MGKKTDPGTSIEHLLKSGAEASEILAGIAWTNMTLRLATRQLTNLYDEALDQDLAKGLAIRISALTHALRRLVRDELIELRKNDKQIARAPSCPCGW